jgi:hypothetical protein
MPAKKKAKATSEKKLNVSVVGPEGWLEAPSGWVTNPGFKVGGGVE